MKDYKYITNYAQYVEYCEDYEDLICYQRIPITDTKVKFLAALISNYDARQIDLTIDNYDIELPE